jgi:hypothetical protein
MGEKGIGNDEGWVEERKVVEGKWHLIRKKKQNLKPSSILEMGR